MIPATIRYVKATGTWKVYTFGYLLELRTPTGTQSEYASLAEARAAILPGLKKHKADWSEGYTITVIGKDGRKKVTSVRG